MKTLTAFAKRCVSWGSEMKTYGKLPIYLGPFPHINLNEVMYYLYLPVVMDGDYSDIRLPRRIACCEPLITQAIKFAPRDFRYVYLSARKGWATKDSPLNRPGWHADGFGTDDINCVWWKGPGTRFANQAFDGIVSDRNRSQQQFDKQVRNDTIVTYDEGGLYGMDSSVVHSTPLIGEPCMRQYVKISFSDQQYNLENNSHNYLFDYDWPMHSRTAIRNHTNTLDSAA